MSDYQFVIDTAEAVGKLFTGDVVTEEELQFVKDFLTGYSCLPDMDDSQKEIIRDSTVDDIHINVQEAFKQTVYRSYRVRYGITIN